VISIWGALLGEKEPKSLPVITNGRTNVRGKLGGDGGGGGQAEGGGGEATMQKRGQRRAGRTIANGHALTGRWKSHFPRKN